MKKQSSRLSAEDWILAGFRALVDGGPGAVRVEKVARSLETTKGSFYWHFADLATWHAAMLDYWETRAFVDIVAALEPEPRGLPRLRALVSVVGAVRSPEHGGVGVEPALRDWARWHRPVKMAVKRVDAARIAYVEECLNDAGINDSALSRLFYSAHLGLEVLSITDGRSGEAALLALLGLITTRQDQCQ